MKALKVLVMGMTLLLVAGIALLAYGLMSSPKPPSATGEEKPALAADFGTVEVTLPPGSSIGEVIGAGNRVVVRVKAGGNGPERLIVLDPTSGRVAGTFILAVEPVAVPTR